MNSKDYSAIIIGLGCMGASVFRSLKLKGFENILLIDKGEIGGGISSKSGGMVRVFHQREEDRIAAQFSLNVFYNLKKKIGLDVASCLLYTSPSPRDQRGSRMPSSA